MSAIDLVILGMIKQKPQNGYEIQKSIEYRNINKWVKLSSPNIYKRLIQLNEKGYLENKLEKDGKKPEKTVYSITESGEAHFLSLMKKNAQGAVKVLLDFNAVIVNLSFVSDDDKKILLDDIYNGINSMKKSLELSKQENKNLSVMGNAVFEQQYEIAETLYEWISKLKDNMDCYKEKLE